MRNEQKRLFPQNTEWKGASFHDPCQSLGLGLDERKTLKHRPGLGGRPVADPKRAKTVVRGAARRVRGQAGGRERREGVHCHGGVDLLLGEGDDLVDVDEAHRVPDRAQERHRERCRVSRHSVAVT